MIGRLTGRVVSEGVEGTIIVDVHGVGYEVMVPLGCLPEGSRTAEGPVTLHIHTVVREDSFELFGFSTEEQRALFRMLIAVPNVGPKTGVGLIGGMSLGELVSAIRTADLGRLSRVPGIGKKTAERIVLELKGKIERFAVGQPGTSPATAGDSKAERLTLALTGMGYRQAEAARAVEGLKNQLESQSLSELLREALAVLTR
jgi:holliday junction DNA helicase RuvA